MSCRVADSAAEEAPAGGRRRGGRRRRTDQRHEADSSPEEINRRCRKGGMTRGCTKRSGTPEAERALLDGGRDHQGPGRHDEPLRGVTRRVALAMFYRERRNEPPPGQRRDALGRT